MADASDEDCFFGTLFVNDNQDIDYCGPRETICDKEIHQNFLSLPLATELYEILHGIHRIFEHFGITYWLTGGSMIGLKRHGGIIPWDDDIDICCFMSDKDMIFSPPVLESFQANDLHVIEDLTFDIVNPFLSKVFRNEVKSKARKCGKVPYPFCDIFFMKKPDNWDAIHFCCGGQDAHRIYTEELYPIKTVEFGPISANVPHNGIPQLERGYGKNWSTEGQIHNNDHITKQGKGGPTKVFDVSPYLNQSALYDTKKFKTLSVVLPD